MNAAPTLLQMRLLRREHPRLGFFQQRRRIAAGLEPCQSARLGHFRRAEDLLVLQPLGTAHLELPSHGLDDRGGRCRQAGQPGFILIDPVID